MIPEDIFFTNEFSKVAHLEDSNSSAAGLVSKNVHCSRCLIIKRSAVVLFISEALLLYFYRTASPWWTNSFFTRAVLSWVSGDVLKSHISEVCICSQASAQLSTELNQCC